MARPDVTPEEEYREAVANLRRTMLQELRPLLERLDRFCFWLQRRVSWLRDDTYRQRAILLETSDAECGSRIIYAGTLPERVDVDVADPTWPSSAAPTIRLSAFLPVTREELESARPWRPPEPRPPDPWPLRACCGDPDDCGESCG